MALLTSPRFQISYPDASRTDRPDLPLHITNVVTQLDAKGVMFGQGLFANRPVSTPASPGIQGRLYMSTDGLNGAQAGTYILFYDYGTGWALVTGVYSGPPADTITSIEIAPNAVTSTELADGAVDTAAVQDAAITAAKLAANLKPSQGAAGSTEALRSLGTGAGQALSYSNLPSIFQAGTRAGLPANNAANDSLWYYATDIDVIYFGAGGTWHRIGAQAGDIVWTIENTARFGYIICTGQAWPGTTGQYADLYGKWGGQYPSVLPDFPGRQFVAKGTHADVASLGLNEGSAVASRRPKHKHTNTFTNPSVNSHSHGGGAHGHGFTNPVISLVTGGAVAGGPFMHAGGGGSGLVNSYGGDTGAADTAYVSANPSYSASGGSVSTSAATINAEAPGTNGGSVTVGPQTGAEPTDSEAYIVLQPQVKL